MSKQLNRFSARLLESGASGFGGYAASALLERAPDLEKRFGSGALASWKTNLTQRVLELAAAVECGHPGVFESQVLWSRKAFSGRGRDVRDIGASLQALREVLSERLPGEASEIPVAFIDRALGALEAGADSGEGWELDPEDPHQKTALRYLEKVLTGESRAAIGDVVAELEDGMDARELVSRILMPAQREIGRLWHLGKASITEEHMVTAATREALAVITSSSDPAPANGRVVVAAAVAGNAHDVGLRAASLVFELAGWKAICLGADVPAEELLRGVKRFGADLLLLSTMLAVQLGETRRSIRLVRAHVRPDIKILVGGSVFAGSVDLWRSVGADSYADSIDSAVAEGARLVDL